MELLLVLLPFALLFAGIALALFVWAARSGQFDDLETPAVRILFDDETPAPAHGPAGPAPPASDRNGRATSDVARPADGPDKERP
jgi:cbb3-type cytochrome oxidase maturation protein